MLKKELEKNIEQECAHARDRLVSTNSDDTIDHNNEKNIVDGTIKKSNVHDDDQLNSSNEVDKNEQDEDKSEHSSATADDMNGSTVEFVQPADLKPKHLGFTRTLLLAMFAAMIGTGGQFGYALGVMNAPSEVPK
jgi:hypothetical protein